MFLEQFLKIILNVDGFIIVIIAAVEVLISKARFLWNTVEGIADQWGVTDFVYRLSVLIMLNT